MLLIYLLLLPLSNTGNPPRKPPKNLAAETAAAKYTTRKANTNFISV